MYRRNGIIELVVFLTVNYDIVILCIWSFTILVFTVFLLQNIDGSVEVELGRSTRRTRWYR